MDLEKIVKSLNFVPKLWTALSFLLLLIVALTLFFGRNIPNLRMNFLLDRMPEFYQNVSNFSISFLVLITLGYIGLMVGMTIKQIIFLGILLALLNLFIEFYISILNTPDEIDAIFGIVGVILGLIFLILAKKIGLKKNEL